ncbi:MAG: acyl-CoA reductase [Chitinophagaceae bacterium]|nr:acyl-CoA reductase [Chitinophagaceae bacterium]
MNLQHRIDLLVRLGQYIQSGEGSWQEAKEKAGYENGWFIPEFINKAVESITTCFLQKDILENWAASYKLKTTNDKPVTVGVVMAGNIPLVGFHDLLCVFISGHKILIKASSKDQVLIKHLVEKMAEWDKEVQRLIQFSEMLKGCDAYIATGSNNSARYFDQYFGKFPNIIRRNRTSVAIISGNETKEELEKLADDVFLYFGLGCRNVTSIFVPAEYDFVPMLGAFRKYSYLADHHKYKNNYDYNLALHLLNKKYYMTNGCVLLIEDPSIFSPISQLNYEFYTDKNAVAKKLKPGTDIQCIVGHGYLPFGRSQNPAINEYADGIDTLQFLSDL